jgi:hypothetical protein
MQNISQEHSAQKDNEKEQKSSEGIFKIFFDQVYKEFPKSKLAFGVWGIVLVLIAFYLSQTKDWWSVILFIILLFLVYTIIFIINFSRHYNSPKYKIGKNIFLLLFVCLGLLVFGAFIKDLYGRWVFPESIKFSKPITIAPKLETNLPIIKPPTNNSFVKKDSVNSIIKKSKKIEEPKQQIMNPNNSIITTNQQGNNTIINQAPEPKFTFVALSENIKKDSLFRTEIQFTIESKIVMSRLTLRVKSPFVTRMNILPQYSAFIIGGFDRDGDLAFFTWQNPSAGVYKIIILSSKPEKFHMLYDYN